MNQIIGYAIFILCILLFLKLILTLILDKLYFKANSKEKNISLIIIFVLEILNMVQGVINLTNKNYILFYLSIILTMFLLVASCMTSSLFINKYLCIDSLNKIVFLIWSYISFDSEKLFDSYLSSIVLSPVSNKETLNYSFITIFVSVIFIITLVYNIKKVIEYKKI